MLKKMEIRKNELEIGKIEAKDFEMSRQPYLGVLRHCAGFGVGRKMLTEISY
jgi:hypothetical protein